MSPAPLNIGRPWSRLFLWLLFVIGCQSAVQAVDRFVSTTGLDTNNGTTISTPWKTIGKAALSSLPGDVVNIRGGTYFESVTLRVSGTDPAGTISPKGYITFQSYPGESAIIDGTGLIPTVNDSTGLLRLASRSYLIFKNLELRNLKTQLPTNSDVMGVFLSGTSHHVEIRNCKIHDIQTLPPADGIANGIGIYGTDALTPITNIIVDGCEVYNLKTSSSESVTFNGNVDGFQITNCTIHDCDNIGIDCIGFEKTSSSATLDQARNGLVARNLVYNIDSATNPAYNFNQAADGIYVDGGKAITIEGNTVHHCNIGVEVASETFGKVASDCIVRNNFIYQCHETGMYLGGADVSNGGSQNCLVTNNTFFQNDTNHTSNGEISFQFNVTNTTVKQNIFYGSVDSFGDCYFVNDPEGILTNGNTFQRNLYYTTVAAASQIWLWRGVNYSGFTAWKTISGQDSLATFANPQFTSTATPNLHLLAASPARNAGDATYVPASGELEIDAQARIAEGLVDLGADEFVPTITIASTDLNAAEWNTDPASGTLTRSSGNVTGAPLTVLLNITGTATNGTDYTTLTSATFAAGSLTANFTLTPLTDALAEGPETAIIAPSSVPGAYTNGSPNPITVTIADRPLQQWKFTNFGTNANLASIAGDNADPDGDGRPNLLEYATGTLPNTANTGPLLAVTRTGGYLTATLSRTANPVDVTLTPQISSNLTTWQGVPNLVVLVNTATQLQFRDASLSTANAKRFLRVKADP